MPLKITSSRFAFCFLLAFPVLALAASPCESPLVLNITKNTQLDGACTYNTEFRISTSNVRLDCAGATLDGKGEASFGVRVDSKGAELSGVEIVNCNIVNYVKNGILVGWGMPDKDKLTAANGSHDELYRRTPNGVIIRNTTVRNADRVGIYLDDYVTHTLIDHVSVINSGGVGLYLEHSSRENQVINSTFEGNGRQSPREAIAVDSSAKNKFINNTFIDNKAGGIFLYRNCQERIHSDLKTVHRWQGSDENTIRGNSFRDNGTAIWVASRQSRNLTNFDCGDPAIGEGYFEDDAKRNVIESNYFLKCATGIRIEDDENTILNNEFSPACKQEIIVGSEVPFRIRGKAVVGTKVHGNVKKQGRVTESVESQRIFGAR